MSKSITMRCNYVSVSTVNLIANSKTMQKKGAVPRSISIAIYGRQCSRTERTHKKIHYSQDSE